MLHQTGIAHHDIKPENIMVRSENPLSLVLIDFGLTVVADPQTYYATTRNATIVYQAPEIMRKVGGAPRLVGAGTHDRLPAHGGYSSPSEISLAPHRSPSCTRGILPMEA